MKERHGSETAVLAAILRAAHPLLDEKPWIFEDTFAAPFAGIDNDAALLASLRSLQEELARKFPPILIKEWMRSTRVYVSLRSRYAEDELNKAIERGISQYVILGSGLDSFAYRRRDLAASVRVFEIDYPATQLKKQARLRELGLNAPPHLTFVPLDFERESIMEGLQEVGFRCKEPAFFSWLGVAGYLTEKAIVRTLKEVAAGASGSEIVFNYLVCEALLRDDQERQILRMLESLTVSRGEPLRSYFEPTHIAALVRKSGFAQVWDLAPEELDALYLADRTDGLRFTPRIHLMKALVEHPSGAVKLNDLSRLLNIRTSPTLPTASEI
jgi:methyltransferase (TIGR00027 family)